MELRREHLLYQDRLLVCLARAMFDEVAYGRARACILADALLEAGCEDPVWQKHLREDEDHDDEWRLRELATGGTTSCLVVGNILGLAKECGLL